MRSHKHKYDWWNAPNKLTMLNKVLTVVFNNWAINNKQTMKTLEAQSSGLINYQTKNKVDTIYGM